MQSRTGRHHPPDGITPIGYAGGPIFRTNATDRGRGEAQQGIELDLASVAIPLRVAIPTDCQSRVPPTTPFGSRKNMRFQPCVALLIRHGLGNNDVMA